MWQELLLFGKSFLYGMMLAAGYELLRMIRCLIVHKPFWIGFEDLLYWIVSSFFLFSGIYRENGGIMRGYMLISIILGVAFLHYAIGEPVVRGTKRLKNFILRCKIALCKQFFRKS